MGGWQGIGRCWVDTLKVVSQIHFDQHDRWRDAGSSGCRTCLHLGVQVSMVCSAEVRQGRNC
jgi:hypothetical protein